MADEKNQPIYEDIYRVFVAISRGVWEFYNVCL